MKHPQSQVRKALYDLLHNAVTKEDASLVPVYEGEGTVSDPMQILIREQDYTQSQTKHSFGGEFSQVIEVASEQQTDARKPVDFVGAQVIDKIKPDPRGCGFTLPDFQVIGARVSSTRYLTEPSSGKRTIVRLIIRITFKITEK